MFKNLLFIAFCLLLVSCGSQPESDQVGILSHNFQYNFSKNPEFTMDSTIQKFDATLYLYSDFPGNTQLTIKLVGTESKKAYMVQLFEKDTLSPILLADTPMVSFNPILALDTTELAYTSLLPFDLDSFKANFNGYLIVYFQGQDTLKNSNLLIKGKIGN
jgi:hypothetical protein